LNTTANDLSVCILDSWSVIRHTLGLP